MLYYLTLATNVSELATSNYLLENISSVFYAWCFAPMFLLNVCVCCVNENVARIIFGNELLVAGLQRGFVCVYGLLYV